MARTGRFHRGWSLMLWLAAILMVVGTTPRTVRLFGLWQETRLETARLEQELLALRQQEFALEEQLRRVQTEPGRESLARQRGWIRKGEEPLRTTP